MKEVLEVKLPTIWADERAEMGRVREEKRREEKRRRKKIREEKEDQRRERVRRKSRFVSQKVKDTSHPEHF